MCLIPHASGIGAVFGCSDVPLGVPIGLFDVTATESENGQPGTKSKLPYQPGVEDSVQQHLREDRRSDHALPTYFACAPMGRYLSAKNHPDGGLSDFPRRVHGAVPSNIS
jgi:hypothetical protein